MTCSIAQPVKSGINNPGEAKGIPLNTNTKPNIRPEMTDAQKVFVLSAGDGEMILGIFDAESVD